MESAGVNDWPLDNYEPLPYWKTSQVFEDGKQGYDFYAITFKEALHTFADTVAMPWLSEVSEKDSVHGGILINRKTADLLGVASGQRIRVISPAASIEGDAQVVEGIHPQVVGVSNAITRSYVDQAGKKVRGAHFNRLLSGSMKYTDNVTGGLESTARVRLEVV
jgi:anaerobic selenocysteine-containing dehydrogenase